MIEPSRRARRACAVALCLAFIASSLVLLPEPARAAAPIYPLRHSFTLYPGLPGTSSSRPTSCFDSPDGAGYVCRLVSGYTTSTDYVIPVGNVKKVSDPYSSFGRTLVHNNGNTYEGCHGQGTSYWCDFLVDDQVSRQHYESSGYVLRVLWRWTSYTGDQLGCASAVTGLWYGAKAFVVLLNSCKNGPM